MKVLVVDDDVVSRMVLMHLIDACGKFEILEAEDGEDAWQQMAGGLRPAICFCDLRMPRLSGMDLLQRVKADSTLDAMPFVLVTSANDSAPALIPSAETAQATMQRLGINGERLLVYLGGFQSQLTTASGEIAALLARGDSDQARVRLERLHAGCLTLGLGEAAAILRSFPDGKLDDEQVRQALGETVRAVMHQSEAIKRLHRGT
jgi:two-component system chemotaxis response regulator CheY